MLFGTFVGLPLHPCYAHSLVPYKRPGHNRPMRCSFPPPSTKTPKPMLHISDHPPSQDTKRPKQPAQHHAHCQHPIVDSLHLPTFLPQERSATQQIPYDHLSWRTHGLESLPSSTRRSVHPFPGHPSSRMHCRKVYPFPTRHSQHPYSIYCQPYTTDSISSNSCKQSNKI